MLSQPTHISVVPESSKIIDSLLFGKLKNLVNGVSRIYIFSKTLVSINKFPILNFADCKVSEVS